MKKIIASGLILSLLLGFAGCAQEADDDSSGKPSPTSEESHFERIPTETEEPKPDAPSEEAIADDLAESLVEENPHAQITDVSVIKSLTEDTAYTASLTVSAATKYADCTFEAEVAYTKYDQGWMVNDVQWVSSDYQVNQFPTKEEMIEIANQYLKNHEYTSLRDLYEKSPIKDGDFQTDRFTETGMISLSWSCYTPYKHGGSTSDFNSDWVYDETIDGWVIAPAEGIKGAYGSDERIFEHSAFCADVEANFNGIWPTITITKFSENSMDVAWGDGSGHFEHILSTTSQALSFSGKNMRWYLDENGNYLSMLFTEDETRIAIQTGIGSHVQFFVIEFISDDLPPL